MESGTRLDHYEISGKLGAGGMGEVYLGTDTRLGRQVAIKVLPEQFAADPERLARFEQEARAAAALNHPHIAVLHDIGEADSTHYMVQEHLRGQTLRDALESGPMSLERALAAGIEIASALKAAHRAGIIHRDLKPENVFITEDGHAKVLDFGLAKLTEMGGVPSGGASMSPTVLGTQTGAIMGTAGYMAPEQVHGEDVDHRADLFALGCVLYELVTGQRAFAGDNVHETLSRILSKPPTPLREGRADLPPRLEWIIDKALAKDTARRYQHADDLEVDLRSLAADVESGTALPDVAPVEALEVESATGPGWTLVAALTGVALLLGALGAWIATRPEPAESPAPVRFEFELPEDVVFTNNGRRSLTISPDGSRIVFVGDYQLWTRQAADLVPVPIPGTESARTPFFSPDGQQIGFATEEPYRLERVSVTGGAPVVVAPIDSNPYGASWADDGNIYVGHGSGGIWRVASTGGTPEVVIEVEEGQAASAPQLLPGGEWLLFTLRGGGDWNDASIVAESLVRGERVVLVEGGTDGRWAPTGHLVYYLSGTLFAVPFDPGTMERPVGPASMVEGVRLAAFAGSGQYAFSGNGRLVYIPGRWNDAALEQLAWLDLQGNAEPLPFEPRQTGTFDLSSDGRLVALEIDSLESGEDADQIWIYEVDRGARVLLTTEGVNEDPVWSPDGEWVYFSSVRDGNGDIWRRRADRSGPAEPVLDLEAPVRPTAISADGTRLLFAHGEWPEWQGGILSLDREAEPEMILGGSGWGVPEDFSPDGRFVVFTSSETGQAEVSVLELATGRTFPVSTPARGGADAHWSADGQRIYYESVTGPDAIMAADIGLDPFTVSEPVEVVNRERSFRSSIGVTADGQRFLVSLRPDSDSGSENTPRIRVVLDWFEELKQRLPTRR